jgi:hypothetical protein
MRRRLALPAMSELLDRGCLQRFHMQMNNYLATKLFPTVCIHSAKRNDTHFSSPSHISLPTHLKTYKFLSMSQESPQFNALFLSVSHSAILHLCSQERLAA